MHAWSKSMLLLLHSPFMLSMVKMLLKGEAGGCALNSRGNYIVDLGKGVQWLSVRVVDSKRRGRRFEPHWHHCVVVLEQDTFILA